MKPICFYHRSDLDGVCSAAIVKHFVPDVELYGMEYGEPFPWDRAVPEMKDLYIIDQLLGANPGLHNLRRVYMVDFSLPVEYMKSLAACSDLVWIDHHKTAIDACHVAGVNPAGLREVFLAACELCWVHFKHGNDMSPIKEIPEAVSLLGIYDSWRKDDPEWQKALAFQYGMRALPGIYSPDCTHYLWRSLFESANLSEEFVLERCLVGQGILNYQAEVNQRACESGAESLLLFVPPVKDGDVALRLIACNTIVFNSQFFASVYDPEKHDIMVAYCRVAPRYQIGTDGKAQRAFRWKVGIYSTKADLDCGAIAKAFGGGGHKGAAGFVCDKLPWEA